MYGVGASRSGETHLVLHVGNDPGMKLGKFENTYGSSIPTNPRLYLSCGAPWHVSGRGVANAPIFCLLVYRRLIMLGMAILPWLYSMMILRLNPAYAARRGDGFCCACKVRKCRKSMFLRHHGVVFWCRRRVKRGLYVLTYGLSDGTIVLSIGGVFVKVT